MNKAKQIICVIGAGVNGLSTAIVLLKAGYKVKIFSKDKPVLQSSNYHFASAVPSASIIPHSVYSPSVSDIFTESQDYFENLMKQNFPGISQNEHFELFAETAAKPEYLPFMRQVEEFPELKQKWFPKHPVIEVSDGWKFDCFFTDWPVYYPALVNEFLRLGGTFEIKELNKTDIKTLPFSIVINCAGYSTVDLFDEEQKLLYKGHLLHVPDVPLLKNPKSNRNVSYNFMPNEHFSIAENTNIDVYCYPRSDGWILGGSRQKGHFSKNGKWIGEDAGHPVQIVQNQEIPAYIYLLNKEIIEHSFGIIFKASGLRAKTGFRYVRSLEDGLRIEKENIYDKTVIHNYGHGGSGVTLSWGSAIKVQKLLENEL